MKRSNEGARLRSIQDPRSGSNLLEVVVAMGLLTAFSAVAVSALLAMTGAERVIEESGEWRMQAIALGDALRSDVSSATSVVWDEVAGILEVSHGGRKTEYLQTNERLRRVSRVGDDVVAMEEFRCLKNGQLIVEVDEENSRVVIRLRRLSARSSRDLKDGVGAPVEFEWKLQIGIDARGVEVGQRYEGRRAWSVLASAADERSNDS